MKKHNKLLKKLTLISLIILIVISVFNIGKVLADQLMFKLTEVVIKEKSDGVEASIVSYTANELVTDTTFHKLNDHITYKLTIKNTSNSKYKLKLVSDNSGNNYVDYVYDYNQDEELQPDTSTEVLLTATYNTELTNISNRNQNEEFKIIITLEDEQGNTTTNDIVVNPNTHDNIVFYIILLSLSTTGLLIIIVRNKKIKKMLIITFILTPFIVEAASPSLIVTFINRTKLFDKVVVNKVINGENVVELIDYNTGFSEPDPPEVPGYTFGGWYVGDEPYTFGTSLTDDVIITAKLNIITYHITYNLNNGTLSTSNPEEYNVETNTFTLNNSSRQGYTFTGWTGSNGATAQVEVTIPKGSTEDKSYTANFTPNTDTAYTVVHKYQNLDGSWSSETENKTGSTDDIVTPPFKSKAGFDNPASTKQLKILGSGDASIDYEYKRTEYHLTLTNPEDIDTTFNTGDYPFETQITLTAKAKEHYNFTGWSNGETSNPLVFNITEDIEVTPVYELKSYTVTFDSQGGSNVDSITKKYNTEIGTLPEPTKENYIFAGWYTDTSYTTKISSTTKVLGNITYYAKWNNSIALATISNENISLERYTSDSVTVTNCDEEYTYTSNDPSIVTANQNGTINALKKGTTTITITGNTSNLTRTINVEVYVVKYDVSFDSQGGNNIDPIKVNADTAIGTLPVPEQSSYAFLGWYTETSEGTKITEQTIIDNDYTFYAHWTPLVCKIATVLHTEECEKTSGGCYAAGYRIGGSKNTTTITYGTVPDTATMQAGYAYDCDVNADGVYDSATERFYYLRTLDGNAVLISHTNYEGVNEQQIENTFSYDEALTMLPTADKWKNLSVTYGDYAARFPTYEDLKVACDKETLTQTGDLDRCVYLLENSKFSSESLGRSGVWLEMINNTTYRYHTNTRAVTSQTNANVVRPVIEVPLALMDKSYINMSTVTFDSQGGPAVSESSVETGTAIGTLPQPERKDYDFKGWFTDTNYTTQIDENTIIDGNVTFYAKWELNVVAEIAGTTYKTVQAAIDDVPTTNTKTTIKLLQDAQAEAKVANGMYIEFDLQNFTLSNETTQSVIVNSGKIEIINGKIASSGSTAAVHNNSDGTVIMTGGNITATGSKQAIYNDGGVVEISGNPYLSAKTGQRGTVQNQAGGKMTITGGTIISINQQAVNNYGELVIGTKNDNYDSSTPVLQGKTYGITTSTDIAIYDGILKGRTLAIDDETKITKTEDNALKVNDTEGQYKTLYYSLTTNKYIITLDANGGTVSNSTILVNIGDPVGQLPTPANGIYTFSGWFTDTNYTTQVNENTVPTESTTFVAKWTYNSSNDVVNYSTNNKAMQNYYDNLDSWLNSDFETNMMKNFEVNNCKCKDNTCSTAGTISCDKPEGYDTKTEKQLNVYLTDGSSKAMNQVKYTFSDKGVIYNMIPNKTYYWEVADDPTVYGYVKVTDSRRIIQVTDVGNVRDLGGLQVDVDNNGKVDGTLKYEILYRGEKLGTNKTATYQLNDLGIKEEVDLRGSSEIGNGEVTLSNFKQREIKHYQINQDKYPDYYVMTRKAVKEVMEDVVAGNTIYFHCRIGADRTGTLAYILEGLLGVTEEQRLEDYELTFFSGLVNRTRYYKYDPTSSVSTDEKFVYMYDFMKTNEDIYKWYMSGTDDWDYDAKLIEKFRSAMIDKI